MGACVEKRSVQQQQQQQQQLPHQQQQQQQQTHQQRQQQQPAQQLPQVPGPPPGHGGYAPPPPWDDPLTCTLPLAPCAEGKCKACGACRKLLFYPEELTGQQPARAQQYETVKRANGKARLELLSKEFTRAALCLQLQGSMQQYTAHRFHHR